MSTTRRIEGLSVNVFTAGPGGDRMVRVRDSLKEIEGHSLLEPYVELGLAIAEPLSRERLQEKLARNSRALRFAPTREIVYRQAVLLALAGRRKPRTRSSSAARPTIPDSFRPLRACWGNLRGLTRGDRSVAALLGEKAA